MLSKYPTSRLLYAVLVLSLFSCGRIFDKHPVYSYQIKNNTSKPIEVSITSPVIANNAVLTHTIGAGATGEVWEDTEYDDDSFVYDREQFNQEVTEFHIQSISKSKTGLFIKYNPNEARRWAYEKKKNREATYTMTVEEADF
jgi:hypothetical protein